MTSSSASSNKPNPKPASSRIKRPKGLGELARNFKQKDNLNGRDIRTLFTTAQLRGRTRETDEGGDEGDDGAADEL